MYDQTSSGGQALPWLDLAAFCAPPSPQIYLLDADRRHGLAAAEREFERLQRVYPALGYTVSLLPKLSVPKRADCVLSQLASN